MGRTAKALSAAQQVQLRLPNDPPAAQAEAISDVRRQLDRLLPPGFVTTTGAAHLEDLARYLTAIERRLEKLPQATQGDRERMQRVHGVQEAFDRLLHTLPTSRAAATEIRDIGRQIEELRVSLWAQQLGTPRPVSEQRIYRAIDAAQERS